MKKIHPTIIENNKLFAKFLGLEFRSPKNFLYRIFVYGDHYYDTKNKCAVRPEWVEKHFHDFDQPNLEIIFKEIQNMGYSTEYNFNPDFGHQIIIYTKENPKEFLLISDIKYNYYAALYDICEKFVKHYYDK